MKSRTKIELLEEVQEFISQALKDSRENRFGSKSEKKNVRKLKRLCKELDEWMSEMIENCK